jgi:hypothetical protein
MAKPPRWEILPIDTTAGSTAFLNVYIAKIL